VKKRYPLVGVMVALVIPFVVVAGASGGAKASAAARAAAARAAVSGSVSFDGIWTGSEATAFGDVIKAFNKLYPNVKINYKSLGNNLPTILATAITGGNPPDMADIAQPGYVNQLVQQGHLKPITYAKSAMAKNFAASWLKLGTFKSKLYALVFKVSNKSQIWYNVPDFKAAGIKSPPKTFSQLLSDAQTLKASGVPAYSIGGSDGWTLTDMFENIYLRTFGFAKYNLLTAHKIKWTDPTVKTALKTMAKIIGDTSNVYGGTSGALQYGFNDSVTNAFGSPSKAAIVFEADFVSGVILSSTKSKAYTGFNVAPWPSITPGADAGAVEISGDLFVTFRDNPAIEAFVKFLATPAAANAWASQGGFVTGNHNVNLKAFPDKLDLIDQQAVQSAKQVVFDMSDAQPAAFGATTGQGEWGLFQKFLQNPSNVNGTASALESAAAKAYSASK
jgi:alpha-glucoside transport system substrate-binding protein